MNRRLVRSLAQHKTFFTQYRNKSWDIRPYTHNNDTEAALIVTMNSNPVNAMTPDFMQDMKDTIDTLNRDYAHIKHVPILLESPNEKTYSAGLNLQYITTELGQDKKKVRKFVKDLNEMFYSWYMLDRPTVALLNGHCIAGGLVLALCNDFRVSSNDTRKGAKQPMLTLREVFLGLNFPGPIFEIVRSQISNIDALYQATLTGRTFTPSEANDLGMISKLVNITEHNHSDKELLYKAAMSLLNDRIDTKLSATAYSTMKKTLKESSFKANAKQHKLMDKTFIDLLASQPVQEKIQSVLASTKKK